MKNAETLFSNTMKKTLKDKILEIVPAKCDSWVIYDVYIFDSWIVWDFVTYLIID